MRHLLIWWVIGGVACTAETPAPSPAPASAAPATAAPPVIDARLPLAYRAQLTAAPDRRLDVWITADAIRFDEGPLYAATPAGDRAARWPAGAPGIVEVTALSAFALDAEGLTRLKATFTGAAKRGGGAEDLRLIADRDTPYALAMQVLGEARGAGFKRWWIRGKGRSAPGDFRTRRARWCLEAASSPTPCTITWALVTATDTWLQNRSSAEAACGVPPDTVVPPPPAASIISGARGDCRRLRHQGDQVVAAVIPPHRQKHIKGTRCAFATVAAWPKATWTQVVEVADGLRAAGHDMIAFSRAEEGEICPILPAAAPASGAAPGSAPAPAPASASASASE